MEEVVTVERKILKMKKELLNASVLSTNRNSRFSVNLIRRLWREYGHSLEELPNGAEFTFNMLECCPNLQKIRISCRQFFYFDETNIAFTSQVKELNITGAYSWEVG